MKDLLLALSIIWCSQNSLADCSAWNVFGAGSPKWVDGTSADYQSMAQAQQDTLAYIDRLERTIDRCRLDDWQHYQLVEAMESAAARYNRELVLYRDRQHHPDKPTVAATDNP